MEQGLELGLSSDLDLIETFAEILYGFSKVHESGQDKPPVEVVESIVRLHGYSFVKLCQCVVDLVEHHHTVTPVSIVLGIFLVKANGCSKVIHCLLVVPDGHEGLSPFTMVLGMSGSLVVVGSGLQTSDGLAEF